MSYYIFGEIEDGAVKFVGCSKSPNLPANAIFLQEIEHYPEAQWVKWSMRFRRTIPDCKVLDHPYAQYFKNPTRVRRLLGDKEFERYSAEENAAFLNFHERNVDLLDNVIRAALGKKEEGRNEYSIGQLLGEVRWGDTEIDRGVDKVKLNEKWGAWYSRAVQIVDPRLVGFFAVRSSVADGLVWIDGRTWQQFASDNSEKINWCDPFSELPDGDWECRR